MRKAKYQIIYTYYELLKKHPNSEVRDAIEQLKQNKAYEKKQSLFSKLWYCFASNSTEYQEAVERCQIADANIAKFPSGDLHRNTAYLNAYGEYKYKDKNWSIVPEEELPVWVVMQK